MQSQSIFRLSIMRIAMIVTFALALVARAQAGDANYVLGFTNLTAAPITVTVIGQHSFCTYVADGTQVDHPYNIDPGQTQYVGFYRAGGGCHGEQGNLGVRYVGALLPQPVAGLDDYEQFWFDTDGGFDKSPRGPRARAPNSLQSFGRTMGDTVFLRNTIGNP